MSAEQEDLTGRRQLGWNVTVAWLGHVVVVVSGFVIPRMIDRRLDQTALGIWDFGWTTVTYFRFLGLGLAGGLNRYVAFYRARSDREALVRAVSSTAFLQLLVGTLTLAVAFGFGELSHVLFHESSAETAHAARWLVTLLGTGLAIKMYCWPARGVLTGHHLWATNSAITACGDILLLGLLLGSLYGGGGLTALGSSYLATAVVTEALRSYAARRVYGGRLFAWSAVDKRMMKKMLIFGMKTNLSGLPVLIVVQTVSLLLAAFSGPAALAIYTRPLALIRHVHVIVAKFTTILTSTTASLNAMGKEAEIREFLLAGTRSAYAISLPLLLVVAVYGDVIVRLWMGEEYVDPMLAPLLTAGVLLPFANTAAMQVLIGLNAHGRVAIWSLVVCSTAMLIGASIAFAVGWTPRVAAVVMGTSLTVGPGVIVPLVACHRLRIGLGEYLQRVFALPLTCNAVFTAILLMPRFYYPQPSPLQAALATIAGGAVLAMLYWHYLLERETKEHLLRRLSLRYRPAG